MVKVTRVQGVLAGFATIGILIGLGFLLASLRILDATAQGVLTRTAFYVASPALMITVLGGTDVQRSVTGSKIAAWAEPRIPPALSWPPTTRIRPSASCA